MASVDSSSRKLDWQEREREGRPKAYVRLRGVLLIFRGGTWMTYIWKCGYNFFKT